MHGLPQHEARQALLARRSDDEVGVGLVLRVQVRGDIRVGEGVGELVEGASLGRRLAHHGAHGLGDLVSAAVADRDIDGHSLHVGGARDGRTQVLGHLLGQQGQIADDGQLPAPLVRQEGDGLADDAQQLTQLASIAREIIGGQEPQRHNRHTRVVGPLEELADLPSASAVSLRGGRAQGLRPAAVTVQDHADVGGHGGIRQLGFEATLVHVVEHVPLGHDVPPAAVAPCGAAYSYDIKGIAP